MLFSLLQVAVGSLASFSVRNFYFTLGLHPISPLKGWQPLHNLNQSKAGAAALSHTGSPGDP